MPAHGAGEVAPELEVSHDHTVGMAEELDRVDADHRRAGTLFGLAERTRFLGWDREPGFATGHQRVGDPFARRGPLGDRTRRPVLEIIGVGDDRQSRRPVLG